MSVVVRFDQYEGWGKHYFAGWIRERFPRVRLNGPDLGMGCHTLDEAIHFTQEGAETTVARLRALGISAVIEVLP